LPKLLWACEADAVGRFRKLAAFSKRHGLKNEWGMYTRALKALGANEETRASAQTKTSRGEQPEAGSEK
jgi:hypothetical protein